MQFIKDFEEKKLNAVDSLESLLTLIILFSEDKECCSRLQGLWKIYESEIGIRPNDLVVFSRFMAQFSIEYQAVQPNKIVPFIPKSKRPSLTEDDLKSLKGVVDSYIEDDRKHTCKFGDKYAWLESARDLADFLSFEYPEDLDPGKIIGDYLKILFPVNKLKVGAEIIGEYDPSKSIEHGSQIHELITRIGRACIESSTFSAARKVALSAALSKFLNPLEGHQLPDGITIDSLVDAALHAPQGFFLSWARGWWLAEAAGTPGEFCAPPLTSDVVKKLVKVCALAKTDITTISNNSNKHCHLTLRLLSDAFLKIKFDSEILIDNELKELITELLNDFSFIRREVFAGVSPLDEYVLDDIFFTASKCVNLENIDLAILLSQAQFNFSEIGLTPDCELSEKTEYLIEYFDEKEVVYSILFDKCLNEGLPELANALFSFYLFARNAFCRGYFKPCGCLQSTMAKALELPGHKTLKHTLEVVINLSERSWPTDPMSVFSRRVLRQWAPLQAQLYAINGNKPETGKEQVSTKKDVTTFLVDQLGKERWQKLTKESQDQLVTAEIIWRKAFKELGFGITDCSGLISNYSKVIEKELIYRLNNIYQSDCYCHYVKKNLKVEYSSKPTAGWLIRLLQNYDRLPPELQQMLENSPVRIHHNKNLIKSLDTLTQFHRNVAAHSEPYDMSMLVKYKKIFWQDKTIHDFCDAID